MTTNNTAELAQQAQDQILDAFEAAYENATSARDRMTAAGLAYIGHIIRRELPGATAITVHADELTITAIQGADGTLWAVEGSPAELPARCLDDLHALLTDVLTFGRDEEVLIDQGWAQDRSAPQAFTIGLPAAL